MCYTTSNTSNVISNKTVNTANVINTDNFLKVTDYYDTCGITLSVKDMSEDIDRKFIEVYEEKKRQFEEEDRQKAKKAIQEKNKRLRSLVKKVTFSGPVTIIKWNDGSLTKVRQQDGDPYDAEKAILACMAKKLYEDTTLFNDVIRKYVEE